MAKVVTLDKLGDAIRKELEEYEGDVKNNLQAITKKVTQQGVKALKTESRNTFGTTKKRKRKYADTWTSTTITGRLSTQGTIYNTQAGLPHLLENGHVVRNGTHRTFSKDFVEGREHIGKVEWEIEKLFMQEVKSKL